MPAAIRKLPERILPSSTGVRLDGAAAQPELRPDGVADPRHSPAETQVAATTTAPARAPAIQPLSLGRYKVQLTASAALRDKLVRLQALMRASVPDGDLAAIIEDAVTEKLERLEARRFAHNHKPRRRQSTSVAVDTAAGGEPAPSSRHIPAAVRRAVHERDGGRCRYVDAQGRRCTAREGLEFHHRRPYGYGGGHSIENVRLMCHAHNAYLAEVDYGARAARRWRARPAADPARADGH